MPSGRRANITTKGRSKSRPFVMIDHQMIDTPAWRSLSGVAVKLLMQMARLYNGANNGEIAYSVRRAREETGAAVNTVRTAISELEDRGFIEATEKGAFSVKVKLATTWRLTFQPTPYKPPTHDYRGWAPK